MVPHCPGGYWSFCRRVEVLDVQLPRGFLVDIAMRDFGGDLQKGSRKRSPEGLLAENYERVFEGLAKSRRRTNGK